MNPKVKQYGVGVAFIACAIAAGLLRHFFPEVVKEEYLAALSTVAALGLWMLRSPVSEPAPQVAPMDGDK